MRDELIRDFDAAARALIAEGTDDLSDEAKSRLNEAVNGGFLPEIVYSMALPAIVFRFVNVNDGRELEIFRVVNPPSAMN